MNTMSIANYMMDNIECLQGCDKQDLLKYISWYIKQGLIYVVTLQDQIVGVGNARPVKSTEEGIRDPRHVDWSGDIILIEYLVGQDKSVGEFLYNQLLRIIGERKYIAFRRFKYFDRCKIYEFKKITSKRGILNYGNRTSSSS